MVGKLNIDQGLDYAFDIRRAREVAEGASSGGGGQQGILAPGSQAGPYIAPEGCAQFWLKRSSGQGLKWHVGFDIDQDPEPDVWVPLGSYLNDAGVSQACRDAVQTQAEAVGWGQ